MRKIVSIAAAGTIALTATVLAQTMPGHPNAGQTMGFDMDKTVHHFYLYDDGGAIDVSVKDKADKTNLAAIREHLSHIAMMFGQGNFEMPMEVHETKTMPGIADLAKMKDKIKYAYADQPTGGRVDIITTDKAALAAVHAFLKFQIEDHKTGDKAAVSKRKGSAR